MVFLPSVPSKTRQCVTRKDSPLNWEGGRCPFQNFRRLLPKKIFRAAKSLLLLNSQGGGEPGSEVLAGKEGAGWLDLPGASLDIGGGGMSYVSLHVPLPSEP